MTTSAPALPHWDMAVVYPGLESPEFEGAFEGVVRGIDDLAALFDARGVAGASSTAVDDSTVRAVEEVIERYNAVLQGVETVSSYIQAFVTTDSRDAVAQAWLSRLEQHTVRLSQLSTRFIAWIGSMNVAALIERSGVAREHAFALQQAKERAAHLMSAAEEDLAAELDLTGGAAWGKLHSNAASQLLVPLPLDGEERELPMSVVRNLAFEWERETRRRAYEAELAAWAANALPHAAALNSIKGQVNTLSARRGWDSPLDEALADNHIDRQTLDAMLAAARESFPDFRRYLRAKARALGVPALAWYDLFAPVGDATTVWEWDAGTEFVAEQFGTYSQRLRDFALRAFREDWIDAEPRVGKEGGGFCMPLRADESRILVNYTPAFDGVSTVAHELGHGYHNLNLAHRTMLQRDTPMTLAETASTFCETIIREAALAKAGPREQIALLEAALQGSCQIVVDISSRFLFESRVFGDRKGHELSVDDLCALMREAQRETYGDGLDPDALHPYMWAVKSHYYSSGFSFYNFPYMFGELFGLGLYARYQQDPEGFKAGYDELLSSTGLADVATLAARFDIDVRTPDFWRASLDVVRAGIDRFERLVAGEGEG